MREIRIAHHGRTVYGKAYMPEDNKKHPLIIFSHGYNGHMDDFSESARFFCRQGYVAVCFTFCGGSMRDTSGYATSDMTLFTEVEDLKAVTAEAASWKEVDSDRIFLFGGSMGGLVSALTAAALQNDIKGLILLYPALCISDNWRKQYPLVEDIPEKLLFWDMVLGKDYFMTARELQVYDSIRKYTGKVLIMHGTADEVVPVSYGEQARDIYEDAEFYPFFGEGHGFSEEGNRRMEAMAYMFAERVKGKKQKE